MDPSSPNSRRSPSSNRDVISPILKTRKYILLDEFGVIFRVTSLEIGKHDPLHQQQGHVVPYPDNVFCRMFDGAWLRIEPQCQAQPIRCITGCTVASLECIVCHDNDKLQTFALASQ